MKNNNDTNYSPIADDIFYNDLPPLTKEEKCIYSKEECTITTPKWCGENQFTYTKGDDKDCYIKIVCHCFIWQ